MQFLPKAFLFCSDAFANCITQFSNHVTKVSRSWHSFECVFTNLYFGGIQSVRWDSFIYTLLVSKHAFSLQRSFNSQLLWIQRLQVWQIVEFAPTPKQHPPQGHLTFTIGFWASLNEPSIFLPTFILRPRVSRLVSRWMS